MKKLDMLRKGKETDAGLRDLDGFSNVIERKQQTKNLKSKIRRGRKKKKTIQALRKLDSQLVKIKLKETQEEDPTSTKKVTWSVQQKMYAMTENYFGVALFLIFRLFKTYHNMFWISIMIHSVIKIAYSMIRIFKNKSCFIQIVNGLVVGGEVCRYMLYLIMLIWTRESKTEQILQDQKYGSWMVWLLVGELFFHLIGFFMTIFADCKTRYQKFQAWRAKKNDEGKPSAGKSHAKIKTQLFSKKGNKGILGGYVNKTKSSLKSKKFMAMKKHVVREDSNNFNFEDDAISQKIEIAQSYKSKMTNPYEKKYSYEFTPKSHLSRLKKDLEKEESIKVNNFSERINLMENSPMISPKEEEPQVPKPKEEDHTSNSSVQQDDGPLDTFEEELDNAMKPVEEEHNLKIVRPEEKKNSAAWRIEPPANPEPAAPKKPETMLKQVLKGKKTEDNESNARTTAVTNPVTDSTEQSNVLPTPP